MALSIVCEINADYEHARIFLEELEIKIKKQLCPGPSSMVCEIDDGPGRDGIFLEEEVRPKSSLLTALMYTSDDIGVASEPLMKTSYPRSFIKYNKVSRHRLANSPRGVVGFGKMKWR